MLGAAFFAGNQPSDARRSFWALLPGVGGVRLVEHDAQRELDGQPVLEVERLVAGGEGLARLPDGQVTFVAGAVPGDRVRALQLERRRGVTWTVRHELVARSTHRVQPRCAFFDTCGGCDWMMLDKASQREHKRRLVSEALRRIGGLSDVPVAQTQGDRFDAYRSRLRLQLRQGQLGFFSKRSHRMVEPEHCLIATPVLNLAVAELRRHVHAGQAASAAFDSVEFAEADDGKVALFFRAKSKSRIGQRERAWLDQLRQRFVVAASRRESAEEGIWQSRRVLGVELRVPPGTFRQVNWEVNQRLVAAVVGGARQRSVERFLDLYAGAGNFTLPLAAAGLSGVSVESEPLSQRAARASAEGQGLAARVRFRRGDSASELERLAAQGESFDLVVADPPRAGMKDSVGAIAQLCEGYAALCSCNPTTLARDLRSLVERGFLIESVQPFDMFPHTHHVEVLVWLRAPVKG